MFGDTRVDYWQVIPSAGPIKVITVGSSGPLSSTIN